jgi:hypothetical protein
MPSTLARAEGALKAAESQEWHGADPDQEHRERADVVSTRSTRFVHDTPHSIDRLANQSPAKAAQSLVALAGWLVQMDREESKESATVVAVSALLGNCGLRAERAALRADPLAVNLIA